MILIKKGVHSASGPYTGEHKRLSTHCDLQTELFKNVLTWLSFKKYNKIYIRYAGKQEHDFYKKWCA